MNSKRFEFNFHKRTGLVKSYKVSKPDYKAGVVPEAIEQLAVVRYKVVPAHESMFHRWAVVAGDGSQQLYLGREVECENMARKFAGAFLDGAFLALQNSETQSSPTEQTCVRLKGDK